MDKIKCDMVATCERPGTHIGEKGYAYCTIHGPQRRATGYERVRKMRPWEVRRILAGKTLPSYEPGPMPKEA